MYVIIRDIAHKLLLAFIFLLNPILPDQHFLNKYTLIGSNLNNLQCEFDPEILENHKDRKKFNHPFVWETDAIHQHVYQTNRTDKEVLDDPHYFCSPWTLTGG